MQLNLSYNKIWHEKYFDAKIMQKREVGLWRFGFFKKV